MKLICNDPMPFLKEKTGAYCNKVAGEIEAEAVKILSKPGGKGQSSAPRRRSGRLLKSVGREFDPTTGTARVGTNWFVGRFMELGTRLMRAHPWLGPAWQKVARNPPRPDP